MTRTELLSLAERLALRSDPDSRDACIALRKLAELRPWAWDIYIAAEERGELVRDLEDAVDELTNCDCSVAPLYQLSEVLTDE